MSAAPRRAGFHSVRTRLMLWNVGIVALVLAAMGGLISYTIRGKLMAAVEADLRGRANRVAPPQPMDGPDGEPDGFGRPNVGPPPFPREPDGSLSPQLP